MDVAILRVLKSAGVDNFTTGVLTGVPIVCGGVKGVITNVIVNSSFAEFATLGAGRKAAVKIVCGGATTYVLGSKIDLLQLQGCCINKINIPITISCDPTGTVTVVNVLGETLGGVTTPEGYATAWNANATNQRVGVLYANSVDTWNFTLLFNVGNEEPIELLCTSNDTTPPVLQSIVVNNADPLKLILTYNENLTVHSIDTSQFDVIVNGTPVSKASSNATGLTTFIILDAPIVNGNVITVNYTSIGGAISIRDLAGNLAANFTAHAVTNNVAAVVVTPKFQWLYLDTEPTDFPATFTANSGSIHEQNIVEGAGVDASLSLTGMGANKWFLLRWPTTATVTDFTGWYNTALNNGSIPDSVMEAIVTVSGYKYLKSNVAVTMDNTQPLILSN